MRPEPVQGAGVEVPGEDSPARPGIVHEEIEGKVLDEELRVVLQRLLVEGVEDRVAGPIRRCTGTLRDPSP